MKTWKNLFIILIGVGLALGVFALKTYRDAGEFKTIKPHFSGQCNLVRGVQSSEDITIDPETGIAFISSDDRRPWFRGKKGKQGAIFAYSLISHGAAPVNLTKDLKKEFHPHGIALYIDRDGVRYLFVVNHAGGKHYVEILQLSGNKLIYKETITSPLMISPNDLVAVGPRSFYVTNDHGTKSKYGKMFEDYLQLSNSYVLYFDGTKFEKVTHGIQYANGINVSPDGMYVYVASTTGRAILVYRRDKATGQLTWKKEIRINTGPDNIEVDTKGRLWVGCHPKLLTFLRYAKDPNRYSPAQVIMIEPGQASGDRIREVYLNNGRPLSGSSAAAYYKHTLLIGSVFDPAFLVCKIAAY